MDMMGSGRRQRGITKHAVEDGALDQIAKEAEARLAAKRLARAEAREIRMRELERQHRDSEENDSASTTPVDGVARTGGRLNSLTPRLNSYQSSRRSSEDSLDDTNSIRELRAELRETEDRFRKAMIGNAQLDNEKAAALYQVELYKDRYEELEEAHQQLVREHRERGRQLELATRDLAQVRRDLERALEALSERDTLIQEQGLVIVGGDEEGDEGDGRPRRALVSAAGADMLSSAGPGSIDSKLKRLAAEKADLQDQLQHCRLELEEERARSRAITSTDSDAFDREVNKQIGDYKFKLQKAEQDVSTLQTTVTRLEGQVSRYKTSSETLEKVEAALKTERRRLIRELRDSQARVEELETAHSHLQKRLDKLKNAKSALLKDL